MKPTPQMLHFSALAPAGAAGHVGTLEDLVERKQNFERALAETQAQLASGEMAQSIDQRVQELELAPITAPDTGIEGAIVVLLVGVITANEEGDSSRFPLPGLCVELRFDPDNSEPGNSEPGNTVKATTDLAGVAALEFSDEDTGPFDVVVLGPDGQPVACHNSRKPAAGHPPVLLEVAESPALSLAFEKGQVWAAAAQQSRARADELKAQLNTALSNQETLLADALEELDQAIAACK